MYVLVVEDDKLTADLIATLVKNVAPDVNVLKTDSVPEAIEAWVRYRPGLIICDWQLNGAETGDELVRKVRQRRDKTRVLMVTGQTSREWVARMLRLGVDDYVIKPFAPDALLARLKPYFESREAQDESHETDVPAPEDWLGNIDHILETVPNSVLRVAELGNYEELRALSALQLEYLWQQHAGLTERLIRSANQLLMSDSGRTVSLLREAIAVMGVDRAVSMAFALSVGERQEYTSPYLTAAAASLSEKSERVAERACMLARRTNRDEALAYTAGLLHNLGDMSVLAAIAWYDEHCRPVDESTGTRLIKEWGPAYGNRIKVLWRLPIKLREMIGATHRLPEGHRNQDMLIMSLARVLGYNEALSEDVKRVARQAGLTASLLEELQAG